MPDVEFEQFKSAIEKIIKETDLTEILLDNLDERIAAQIEENDDIVRKETFREELNEHNIIDQMEVDEAIKAAILPITKKIDEMLKSIEASTLLIKELNASLIDTNKKIGELDKNMKEISKK